MIKKNSKYLLLGHAINVSFPIIITPLLAHKLGIEQFANFAIVSGVVQYFAYLLELGLNSIAIKKFSDAEFLKKQKIFTSIFLAKLLLIIFILPLCIVVLFYIITPWGWSNGTIVLLATPLVTCLTYPAWFFTAENIYRINFIAQILNKIFILSLTSLMINNQDDTQAAAIIFSTSAFIVTLPFIRMWLPYIDLKSKYRAKSMHKILIEGIKASGISVRDAWSTNGITPIIGLLTPSLPIGEFVLAEKLTRALSMPASGVAAILLANKKTFDSFLQSRKKMIIYSLIGFSFYAVITTLILLILNTEFSRQPKLVTVFAGMAGAIPLIYINYIMINNLFIARSRYICLTLIILAQAMITIISTVYYLSSEKLFIAALSITISELILFSALTVLSIYFRKTKNC